jgi:hypothetical protein
MHILSCTVLFIDLDIKLCQNVERKLLKFFLMATARYFYGTFAYGICFYGIYFYGIYIYVIYFYRALKFLNMDLQM